MSQTIDQKVLEFRFENADFEANVKTSLATLEKLKAALNLNGAARGLEGIGQAAKNVNLSGMSTALDTVSTKFSVLEQISIGALRRIGEQAVDAGEKLLKSMTVDNIAEGWKRFGQNTETTATLIAQGYNLDVVEKQMDRLNWFTDETSYNFVDMANNIAKFTATGQELEPSVTAMMGIANWAALSGQNAQRASMAMFQLSQAMSKGALKYDDWKSIQNLSMDTVEFRNKALEAAETLGVVRREADNTFTIIDAKTKKANFTLNEMFTSEAISRNAWFTSDVMMKVFSTYSTAVDQIYEYTEEHGATASQAMDELGDSVDEFGKKAFLAGQQCRTMKDIMDYVADAASTAWMHTFKLIIGNYEEATELYTAMADELGEIFVTPLDNLNTFLEGVLGEPENIIDKKAWLSIFDFGSKKDKSGLEQYADLIGRLDSRMVASAEDMAKVSAIQKLVTETAEKHGIEVENLIKKYGSFNESLSSGWLTSDILKEAIGRISSLGSSSETNTIVGNLDSIREAALAVIRGDYGNDMDKRFKMLEEAGFDPQTVQNYVNALHKFTDGTWQMSEAAFEAADAEIGNVEAIVQMSDAELENAGYTKEEIKYLRELAKQAEETGTPINELMEGMTKPTGKELIFDTILNAYNGIRKVFRDVKLAWGDVFPSITESGAYSFLETIHELSKGLILTKDQSLNLRKTFRGLFSILDMGGKVATGVAKVFGPVFTKAISGAGSRILKLTGSFGKMLSDFDKSTDITGKVEKFLTPAGKALDTVFNAIANGYDKVSSYVQEHGLIDKGITIIKTGFSSAKDNVSGWIESFKGLPGVSSALENLDKLLTKFKSYFGVGEDETFFGHLKNMSFDEIIASFKAMFGDLQKYVTEGKFFEDLQTRFEEFKKTLPEPVQTVITWLETAVGKIKKLFGDGIEAVKGFWNKLSGMSFDEAKEYLFGGGFLSDIKERLSTLFDEGGLLHGIPEKIAGIKDKIFTSVSSLSGIGPKVEEAFSPIKETFDNIVSWVSEKLEGKDLVSIFGTILGAGIGLTTIKTVWDTITTVQNIGKSISDLLGSVKGITDGASDFVKNGAKILESVSNGITKWFDSFAEINKAKAKAGKTEATAKLILSLAVAIGVLVAAVYVLGKMMTPEELEQGGMALAKLAIVLGSLILIATLIDAVGSKLHGSGASKIGIGVLAIALAMLLLVRTLKKMEDLDPDKLWQDIVAVGLLMGALVAVSKHLGKGNSDFSISKAIALIAFVEALRLLVGAIKKLGAMDTGTLIQGMIGVGLLMLALVAVSKHLGEGNKDFSLKKVLGLIVFVEAIRLLVSAVKKLGTMDTSTLVQGMIGVFALVMILKSAMKAFANNDFSKGSLKAGASMVLVAAALKILASVVKSLGKMDLGVAIQGTIMLLVLVGLIGALLEYVSNTSKGAAKAGAAVLMIAIALRLLASTIKLIGKMDPAQAIGGLAGLYAIMLMVKSLLKSLSGREFAGNSIKAGAAVLLVAMAMRMMVSSVKAIGSMEPEQAIGGLLALTAMMLIVKGLLKTMSGPDFSKGSIKAAASLLIISGVFLVMAAVIRIIGGMKPEAVLQGLAVVTALSGLIGALMLLSQYCTGKMSSMIALGATIGILSMIMVGVLALLTLLPQDKLTTSAQALKQMGDVLTELALAISVMTLFNVNPGSAAMAALGIAAFVGVIVAIAAALGALDEWTKKLTGGKEGAITKGLDMAKNIMLKLGEVFGAFVGGFLSTAIPELNDKQFEFVERICDLCMLLKDRLPQEGGLKGLLNGTKDLGQFGKDMVQVAKGFGEFAQAVSDAEFNSEKTEAANHMLNLMADLKDRLPQEGGLDALLHGTQNLGQFGSDLAKVATGLGEYADAVFNAQFNPEKTTASNEMLAFLVDLKNNLPETGGLEQKISGWKSLGNLGDELVPLATGLGVYAALVNVSQFSDEKTESSNKMLELLVSLQNNLPETGGIKQRIVGWKNLGQLGDDLVPLATGLGSYAAVVNASQFSDEKTEASDKMLNMLVDLKNKLPETGGLYSFWSGNKDLAKLGYELVPLALGFGMYAAIVNMLNFDSDKIEASNKMLSMLGDLKSKLPETDGLYQIWTGNKDLAKLGYELVPLALGLGVYASTVSMLNFDDDKITKSQNMLTFLTELQAGLPEVGGFKEKLDGYKSLGNFGAQLVPLALGLGAYAGVISILNFDETKIKQAQGMLDFLAVLQNAEGMSEEGFIPWLTGQKSLGEFGKNLPELATGLKDYMANLGDTEFDAAKIEAANGVLKALATLQADAMESMIVVGSAGTALDVLGNSLPTLAQAIADYSYNIEGIDVDAVNASAKVMNAVRNVIKELQGMTEDDAGSSISAFSAALTEAGKLDLTAFAEAIEGSSEELEEAAHNLIDTFTKALTESSGDAAGSSGVEQAAKDFVTSFGNAIKEDTSSMDEVAKSLVDSLSASLNASTESMGETSVDSGGIANVAKGLLDSFKSAFEGGESGDGSIASSLAEIASNIASEMQAKEGEYSTAGTTDGSAFVDAFMVEMELFVDLASGKVEASASAVLEYASTFLTNGAVLGFNLFHGMDEYSGAIETVFSNAVSASANNVSGMSGQFRWAGNQLGMGLANGIGDSQAFVVAKANYLAQAAKAAIDAALRIASPSKVLYQSGIFAGMGFGNALRDYSEVVYDNAYEMGGAAKSGLIAAINKISDLASADLENIQPTISPVVDLTNVQEGVGAINSMLAFGMPSYDMMSNIGAINAGLTARRTTTNQDIVDALDELGKGIKSMPRGESYTVNGITYDDGSNIATAVRALVRATRMQGRA